MCSISTYVNSRARHRQERALTTAHVDGRNIKLARLACPACHHALQARDVEVIGDDIRIVCASCHRDLLSIER